MGVSWNSLFPENKRTQELLIVCALSLVALATRAYGIWEWPITGDEYFTVARAEERVDGIIGSAYYALVLGSRAIFGASNWSARLPSVLLGVLSVPAFFLMCRSLFGRKAATVGCIFLILSDWHLYHSQIARFYSGVFLFGATSYHLYYLSLTRKKYVYLALFFVSSLFAVSFHATAIFIVVSCGAYSLLRAFGPQEESIFSRKIARVHLLICVILAAISLPKFVGIAAEWGVNFVGISFNTIRTVLGVVENMGVAVFVSASAGLAYLYFEDRYRFAFVSVLAVIPLVSVYFFSTALPPSRPRYMFHSMPIFFALSSYFCVSIKSAISRYSGLEVGIILIIFSTMFVGFVSYYSGRMSLDIRDPVSFVEKKYERGDEVVVFGHFVKRHFDSGVDVNLVESKVLWEEGLVPVAKERGRTWIIVDTYRTAPLRRDLEAWLMENASLKWRKEETRFDYTQRGYEVWLESD
jgi:hypothetical protein